jgi:pimeloyl-ACP methyl ester carboxylesterase
VVAGFSPRTNATDVATVVEALAPQRRAVVGMSLGGLTSLVLVQERPDLVPRLVLVDVTPGVNERKSSSIAAFLDGPPTFASFDDILARTIQYNPTRTESSLRRGILHNAVQLDDGSWVWRHARFPRERVRGGLDMSALWDAVSGLQVPVMLVRGMAEGSVVDDDDEAELRHRQPDARIEHVAGAGHSIQGDRPVELAALLDDFIP